MKNSYMIILAHLLGLFMILFGLWWLAGNMAGLADYKLVIALAAVTVLVVNHFRLGRLGRKTESREAVGMIGYFVVSNYLVMLLILSMVDFGG